MTSSSASSVVATGIPSSPLRTHNTTMQHNFTVWIDQAIPSLVAVCVINKPGLTSGARGIRFAPHPDFAIPKLDEPKIFRSHVSIFLNQTRQNFQHRRHCSTTGLAVKYFY